MTQVQWAVTWMETLEGTDPGPLVSTPREVRCGVEPRVIPSVTRYWSLEQLEWGRHPWHSSSARPSTWVRRTQALVSSVLSLLLHNGCTGKKLFTTLRATEWETSLCWERQVKRMTCTCIANGEECCSYLARIETDLDCFLVRIFVNVAVFSSFIFSVESLDIICLTAHTGAIFTTNVSAPRVSCKYENTKWKVLFVCVTSGKVKSSTGNNQVGWGWKKVWTLAAS